MEKIGKLVLFFTLFFVLQARAVDLRIQSTPDAEVINLDDTLTLTVQVSTADDVDEIEEPEMPNLDSFKVLSVSRGFSQNSSLINTPQGMKFTELKNWIYTYILAPRKVGTFAIGSFKVKHANKEFIGNAVRVQVTNSGVAKRPTQNQEDEEQDPLAQMMKAEEEAFRQLLMNRGGGTQPGMPPMGMDNPAVRTSPKNPNEAFFIQVELDKTSAYEGEQVTVNWYICTRGQMETLDRLKFPTLKGFWKEIIEEVPSIQFQEEIIDGVPYKKALLASHALFPIKAGTSVIDEFKIKSRVRMPSNGFGGFWGKPYEYTKSSEPIKINVKPVPLEGRPSDYTGAVGEFDIQTAVEGNGSYPANQPFKLRVRFEGAGNAKLIELPALKFPPELEVYDTKSDSKFFKNGRSYKEFEVLVVPHKTGEVTIPALSVSFFDPKTGKYYTRQSLPITLSIVEGAAVPEEKDSSEFKIDEAKKAEVVQELKVPDFDFVIEEPHWQASFAKMNPLWWWPVFASIVLGLLIRAAIVLGWRRNEKSIKQEIVKNRLRRSQQYLKKGEVRAYAVEILNLWYQIFGKTVSVDNNDITLEKIIADLPASLRKEYGQQIQQLLEYYQALSFAPDQLIQPHLAAKDYQQKDVESRKLLDVVLSQFD